MLWSIVVALVMGLIIGALARMVLPGHQNLALWETILIGALGSVIGTWIATAVLGVGDNGGIAWIPLIIGVAVAALLIVLYQKLRGGSTRTPV